jgi:thymidylate kinase
MDVLSLIAHIEYAILDTPTPDLVFYLDLTAEQSYARTHARDDAPDLHQDNKMYLRNVRHVYQYLAKDPSWHTITCFNEDGTPRTVDEIHAEIFEIFVAAAGV